MDIVQDNIAKLKQLFPDVFSEGKVDFEKLQETLGDVIEGKDEGYNFTWHSKAQAKRIAQTALFRPSLLAFFQAIPFQ